MAGSIMWLPSASIQPFLSAAEPLSPLPMSSPAAPARPTPNLAIVFLSVAAFASAANMRVIDPLLVQLAATFHVTVGEASIAATVFLFANGVFVLVYGPFGDR
jgi:MFS transporter, YNFM family, putative membrane transport protein